MGQTGTVKQILVAVSEGRTHAFALTGGVPFGGRCDSARVGRETDKEGLIAEFLAGELADIEFPRRPIWVAVACPTWELCAQTTTFERP